MKSMRVKFKSMCEAIQKQSKLPFRVSSLVFPFNAASQISAVQFNQPLKQCCVVCVCVCAVVLLQYRCVSFSPSSASMSLKHYTIFICPIRFYTLTGGWNIRNEVVSSSLPV